jgi:copper chaperone CopZ
VRSALATLPGVYEVGVEFDTQSIFVGYDASMGAPKVASKEMIAVLKKAGFDPWFMAEGWPAGAKADILPAL